MQLSPLALNGYIITNLSIKAEIPKSFDEAQKAAASMADVSTKVDLAKNGDNPRQWKVALQVFYHPTAPSHLSPYKIDIELLGFFEVAQSVDEKKINDIVAANAPAVLFGAARELVLLITSRGPMPPVTLPCVTFAGAHQSKSDSKRPSKVADARSR